MERIIEQTQKSLIIKIDINKNICLFQASERKLHPYRKESTPAEMLMESIRSSSARSSLRKTKGPKLKPLSE